MEEKPGHFLEDVDWTPRLLAALAGLICGLAFVGALKNGFVWDDYNYLVKNHYLRMGWGDFLEWAFTTGYSSKYPHPLTWVSHRLDYIIWGLNPLGHHLVSVALHALNTMLVTFLVFSLAMNATEERQKSLAIGLIAGLFFGLHPLRVEAVAWAAGRKDLLCGLFFLVSLVQYVRYAEEGGAKYYLSSLAAFVLAFLAKPAAASLPLVLLIMDAYPLGRRWFDVSSPAGKTALLDKIPFFVVAALGVLASLSFQQPGSALISAKLLRPWAGSFPGHQVLVPLRGFFLYIEKSILPVNLAPLYPYPKEMGPEHIACAIGFAMLVIALVRLRKRARWLGAIGASYFVMLLPVFPIRLLAADRFSYLPGMAVSIFVGLTAAWAWFKAPRRAKAFLALAFFAVFALLFRATWNQVKIWQSDLKLWNYEIALFGERVPIAYNYRGVAYSREGLSKKAFSDYNRAIKLEPFEAAAYSNRGLEYYKKGLINRAIEDFDRAISIKPTDASFYNNRGIAYAKKGLTKRAIEDYTRALEIEPLYVEALNNRGGAYEEKGLVGRALEDYDKALRVDPADPDVYSNRGLALYGKGLIDAAIKDLTRAIRLSPGHFSAYNNRGLAYLEKGLLDIAIDDFKRAIELKPDFAEAYNNRGIARAKKALYGPAIEDYTRAVELNPEYGSAYYNRAIAYFKKGRLERALEDYTKALEFMPDNPSVFYNRGNTYLKKGSPRKAIRDYTRAIELRPDHARSYNNRGWAYFKAGEYEKAVKDYSKALELAPGYHTARLNRGEAYLQTGLMKEATADFRRACEMGLKTGCTRLKEIRRLGSHAN